MQIDRRKFLAIVLTTGLGKTLGGCHTTTVVSPEASPASPQPQPSSGGVVVSSPYEPHDEAAPYEEAAPYDESASSPVDECVDWDPSGECVGWASDTPMPADECVSWDPSGECIDWAGFAAAPIEECVEWSPAGECLRWVTR